MHSLIYRAWSESTRMCLATLALFAITHSPASAAIAEYEFHDIPAVTGHYLIPYGISNDGIIVGSRPSLVGSGFVLRNGVLTTIEIPGSQSTVILGISPDGTRCVGGWADQADRWHSFLYRMDGTILDLPDLGGFRDSTVATGINDSGLVVGSIERVGETEFGQAFTIQGDDIRTYSAPGARYTEFGGVNNPGQIVGYWNTTQHGENHPFLLEADALSPLPLTFQSSSTEVTDINNVGQIVGWGHQVGVGTFGFLIDGGDQGLIRYPEGASFLPTRLTGINDYGVMVGYRSEPGRRGFIAYPKHAIPEPSSLALLLAGVPLVALRRSWGRRTPV